jgi:inner membrane protein
VSALPRPVSPFNWMVMVEEGERYHYAFVNLLRDTPRSAEGGFIARLDAAYLPAAQAEWRTTVRFGADAGQREVAMAAWSTEGLGFYRWFAAYPAVAAIEQGNPSTCVWFQDLRFLTPGRGTMPFRFGACREAGAPAWIAYKLDGDRRVRL